MVHPGVHNFDGAPKGDYDINDDQSLLKLVANLEKKGDFHKALDSACKKTPKTMSIQEFEKLCTTCGMSEADFLPL